MTTLVRPINVTFENVLAKCPRCEKVVSLNRRSDLRTLEPVGHAMVHCVECAHAFAIGGDSVNAAFELLLFEAEEELRQKRYRTSIAVAAQACEVFFATFMRVYLIYRPWARDADNDIEKQKALSQELHRCTRHHAFAAMRDLFLFLVLSDIRPSNLREAERAIALLPKRPSMPGEAAFESVSDQKLRDVLLAVRTLKILTLRNRVVHHGAYRPDEEETRQAVDEVGQLISILAGRFGVMCDDMFWYAAERSEEN